MQLSAGAARVGEGREGQAQLSHLQSCLPRAALGHNFT